METIKGICSFISFLGDVLSPAVDVFSFEDFDAVFNSTANDDNINDNVATTNNEKR